jgi:hypothetical protein
MLDNDEAFRVDYDSSVAWSEEIRWRNIIVGLVLGSQIGRHQGLLIAF